ncbi:hypothetical protein [Jiella avicenniae]|uniref:Uncharacterized protein n=1 Tax=Jiella avicenniae TaxID=2907202 RepID=A0A9X1TA38_9HYPH|nr:hypothetical protein [Jiella avicenniae]MCE7026833.1 hypothetical protein [Jiella avicenniae]
MMDSPDNPERFKDSFERLRAQPTQRRPTLSEDCMEGEPTLEELLDEPIARLLMAYDRVNPNLLEELVRRRFA